MTNTLRVLNEPQTAAVEHHEGPLLIFAGAGSGKCLGRGVPVLMFDGSVKMSEDVKVGHVLMGPDSLPRHVRSNVQGRGQLFRIDPVKGDSWVCNDVHTMTLVGTNREKGRTIDVPLDRHMARYANYARIDKNWKLWRTSVDFEKKPVPWDPYFIGLWLGDGSRGRPELTNCEPEIIEYCRAFTESIGGRFSIWPQPANNTYGMRINLGESSDYGRRHGMPLTAFLTDECEVNGFKYMPEAYRINSREVRLQILAGLMDTDGHYSRGYFEYTSISHALVEQIAFVARSLGFAAYINDKFAHKLAPGTTYRRVTISGNMDRIPTKTKRRMASERKQIKRTDLTGFSATPIGEGEYFGFELDGDGRFLLGDFTVTHNTRVIVDRIAALVSIHRVPPHRVLAVTFTNKAAREMEERLNAALGEEIVNDLWVGTFHALCARMLRRHAEAAGLKPSFAVYDDDDQRKVATRVGTAMGLQDARKATRDLLRQVSALKQEGKGPDAAEDANLKAFYEGYETAMTAANAIDFDDILTRVVRLLEDPESRAGRSLALHFRHVLVDEFQDANPIQYRLVRALASDERNLCVVGDDDQSIYTWRGADVRIVRGFRDDFPEATVIKLEQNYRSRGNVVNAALGVIRHAQEREPKELWTANESGDPVRCIACESDRDEAQFVLACIRKTLTEGIKPNDIAVFYRTHAQSRLLEEVLLAEKIPYRLVGGVRFFERAEVKDILAYLRLAMNPSSDVDLLRVLNVPSRGLGESTVQKLEEHAKAHGRSLLDSVNSLSHHAGPKVRDALLGFEEIMVALQREVDARAPSELLAFAIEKTGYGKMLADDKDPSAESRIGHLKDLAGSMRAYEVEMAKKSQRPTLADFLERTSLSGAQENGDLSGITLMTVHMAKGLEFDTVFVTGLEEDLFPHRKGGEEGTCDLEEERRLAYVAITRARRRLFLTFADRRLHFGKIKYGAPSRFLADLPAAFIAKSETRARAAANGRGQLSAAPRHGSAPIPAAPLPSSEPRPKLLRDTIVTHPKFGKGSVMQDESDDGTVVVDFGGSAPKMLRSSYLQKAE